MYRAFFKVRFLWLFSFAVLAGGWPMATQAAGLGPALGFAVLASTAITCTGPHSNVTGPVGAASSATVITKSGCTMNVRVAPGAYADFRTAYNAGLGPCGQTLGSTLSGVNNLPTGTYCTTAALTMTTGTLKLTGHGPWNFEIGTGGTGALTATDFSVVSGDPCKVFWWVSQGVTLTRSPFHGTVLGGADITLTDTPLTGRAWATGAATFTRSPILGCTAGGTVPGQCKKDDDEDNDEDDNSDQSGDSSSSHQSATSAKHAEDGGDDGDHGRKDCDSDDSQDGDDDGSGD